MPATVRLLRRRAIQSLEREGGSSKSLQKALRILVYMGEQTPEAGVTELASDLGLTKATVHRLLNAMERFDLIERNEESERYRLGLKLHQLGSRAVESRTLRTEAHKLLVEMSRRSRETVSLATPAPGGVVCLDRLDSPHTIINVCTPVGSMFPAHCTAAGKAILAYMADDEIEEKKITPLSDESVGPSPFRRRGLCVDHAPGISKS